MFKVRCRIHLTEDIGCILRVGANARMALTGRRVIWSRQLQVVRKSILKDRPDDISFLSALKIFDRCQGGFAHTLVDYQATFSPC